jgi:hypothetical protein
VNQIATTAPGWATALNPQTTDDAWKIAQALAKSEFVPKGFRDKPHEILIAAAMGARLGLDVFSALQSVAVVNGRPTLYGDALLAVCQSRTDWRGQAVKWEGEDDNERVTVTIRRQMAGGEVDTYEGRFSVREAKLANLWGKQGPWQQFPRRMMEMRARAYALRGAFADALMGFHAREEMEDVVPFDVTGEPVVRSGRFTRDGDAADKSPGKLALDTALEQVEQHEEQVTMPEATEQAKPPTIADCINAAQHVDGDRVQSILEANDAQSFSGLDPKLIPAVLAELVKAKVSK